MSAFKPFFNVKVYPSDLYDGEWEVQGYYCGMPMPGDSGRYKSKELAIKQGDAYRRKYEKLCAEHPNNKEG